MALKARLTRKITRARLREFLTEHATAATTLEVGAKDRPYRDLFPNTLAGDIAVVPGLDACFDAHHLPFATGAFGCILCTEVLEHCAQPARVLAEFWRALAPGGKLILSTRFIFPLHDAPHDYFRFTRYGLALLAEGAGFREVHIQEEAATVETMAVLMQRLGAQADWKLPLAKAALFGGAQLVVRLGGLLKTEYGDLRKSRPEHAILASGYYLVAVK